MDILFLLLTNSVPLLLLIMLGYFAGRRFSIDTKTIADIVIFIITPVVMFGAIARLPLRPEYFLLPFALFGIAAAMTIGMSHFSSRFLKDNQSNLIGMGASTANTGYFGLPIILALFDPQNAGLYLLMTFALTINESSFAYYIGARGRHTIRESCIKVLRLPALYALMTGLAVNIAGLELPGIFNIYWDKFAGAWTILGMMLLGVALSRHKLTINWNLLAWFTAIKFILWPAIMLALIALDRQYFHLYDARIHTMLLVIGCLPMAANLVAFATQLDVKPGEASIIVLITTIIGVFYIPLMLYLFT